MGRNTRFFRVFLLDKIHMNPVVGLDIAKGESKAQVFLDKGKPHGRSFDVAHTSDGLVEFLELLRSLVSLCGMQPIVIVESTVQDATLFRT